MSSFNPETFLDSTTTEASIRRPPIKPGTELVGVITEMKAATWQGKQDPSKSGSKFDLKIEASTAHLANEGQPEKVVFSDSIMLTLTPDGSAIDYSPGKNPRLRQYRDATGLNIPGQSFNPRMMEGRQIRFRVVNEPYEGEMYDKVGAITKA